LPLDRLRKKCKVIVFTIKKRNMKVLISQAALKNLSM
jgi:hypothetical protein